AARRSQTALYSSTGTRWPGSSSGTPGNPRLSSRAPASSPGRVNPNKASFSRQAEIVSLCIIAIAAPLLCCAAKPRDSDWSDQSLSAECNAGARSPLLAIRLSRPHIPQSEIEGIAHDQAVLVGAIGVGRTVGGIAPLQGQVLERSALDLVGDIRDPLPFLAVTTLGAQLGSLGSIQQRRIDLIPLHILDPESQPRQPRLREVEVVTQKPDPFLRRREGTDQRLTEQVGVGTVEEGKRRAAPGFLVATAEGMAGQVVAEPTAQRTVVHLAQPFIAGVAGIEVADVREQPAGGERVIELQAEEVRTVQVLQLSEVIAERQAR